MNPLTRFSSFFHNLLPHPFDLIVYDGFSMAKVDSERGEGPSFYFTVLEDGPTPHYEDHWFSDEAVARALHEAYVLLGRDVGFLERTVKRPDGHLEKQFLLEQWHPVTLLEVDGQPLTPKLEQQTREDWGLWPDDSL